MLKKQLDKHDVEFQILNLDAKIPSKSSIILTTFDDLDKSELKKHNNYLVYSKKQDFKRYLIKVIAAFRIGYKKFYSRLTFSIDPGKKLGLMIFLDDYYLESYCCFEPGDLHVIIKQYYETFQEDNPKLMFLDFKLGRGVLPIAFTLVEQIYNNFYDRKNMRVLLIDEFKSSKIRISANHASRKFTKDEISALVLTFRNGILVNISNYENIFQQLGNKKLNAGILKKVKSNNNDESLFDLRKVIIKVLNGELDIISATKILNPIEP
ncbi:MAG: hypothetical protein ACFE8G_05630 [Candidatus Hermodarchaeota archaeon]